MITRTLRALPVRAAVISRSLRQSTLTRLCATKISYTRSMSTYFHQPRKSNKSKYFGYSLIVFLGAAYGFWKYITWHNYPPEVAGKLREGLYAEASAGGFDYKKALYSYLAALEEADKAGLDALSDEYTGVQLKVAEMYEKLDMKEEARLVYSEIGTAYIQALADGKKIPQQLRPHLIQRDLRVALKTAYLESATNPQMAKMGLMVHFMMAQEEVAKHSEEMALMIKGGNQQKDFNIRLSFDSEAKSENLEAWQPFRDELFNARDMFVALCIATGDIGLAIQTKLTSTEWMAVSGYDASETLMSFYNVGSIFYLQAEELEVRDHLGKPTMSSDGKTASAKEMAEISMKNASACFTMVLGLIEKLPSKLRRTGDIDDVQALTTYGLGVIALHKGDLDKASDLLREARLRAKGCGYDDLVKNSEMELQKLDKMLANRAAGIIEDQESELPPIPQQVSLDSLPRK